METSFPILCFSKDIIFCDIDRRMSSPFRQFQAFHAVIEKGTVTAAAEHLGVSQPAISNLLAQLERKTSLKLFERARGRLVPTPEATVLYDEIDTVVRGLDHVNQAVVDLIQINMNI